jgi:diguanylate cyclase (GGDEF)-like protein
MSSAEHNFRSPLFQRRGAHLPDFCKEGTLKSLLVPGGLVPLGALLLFNGGFPPLPAAAINVFYYAVFGMGILLAWRFHSSRVLFGLLSLLLAERALDFFSGGKLSYTGPGRIAFDAIAFLLPLNLLVLGSRRERGLNARTSTPVLIAIFVQAVSVAVMCRPGEMSGLFGHILLNPSWFHWAKVPQLGGAAFACAAVFLLVRFLSYGKPLESGFFWALVATFLSFQSGGVGRIPTGYMGTAGLSLLIAMIETSYSMAYQDELTALPARRAFNEAILALKDRYAIAIVDIDHFKKFNDVYGHETGDQVLRLVAGKMARVTGGGRAYRCGGEEFAILFPGKSAKDVMADLDLLRQAIELSSFWIRGQDRREIPRGVTDRRQPLKSTRRKTTSVSVPSQVSQHELSVTVSIGVAEPGARNREVDQVIAAADKALYRAKAAGRNRVELAGASRFRLARKARQGIA